MGPRLCSYGDGRFARSRSRPASPRSFARNFAIRIDGRPVHLSCPAASAASGAVTELDLIGLAVGVIVGGALGYRTWRREQSDSPPNVSTDKRIANDPDLSHRDDIILEAFERLAITGAVDAGTLGQARLLHDVASRVDRVRERDAARGQLAMLWQRAGSGDEVPERGEQS